MNPSLVGVASLVLCACSTQPTYISPYNAPIVLSLSQHVETREPERFVCNLPAALVCKPVLGSRVWNAAWDCVCRF
jgi:hypothetical protein